MGTLILRFLTTLPIKYALTVKCEAHSYLKLITYTVHRASHNPHQPKGRYKRIKQVLALFFALYTSTLSKAFYSTAHAPPQLYRDYMHCKMGKNVLVHSILCTLNAAASKYTFHRDQANEVLSQKGRA